MIILQDLEQWLIHSGSGFGVCDEGPHWTVKGSVQTPVTYGEIVALGFGTLDSLQQWHKSYPRHRFIWSSHRARYWSMGMCRAIAEPALEFRLFFYWW